MKANSQNDNRNAVTDDELLKQFFQEYTQQTIPDNGFTEQVIRRIALEAKPATASRRLNMVWTAFCVVMGIVWACYSDVLSSLRQSVLSVVALGWQGLGTIDLSLSSIVTMAIGLLVLIYTFIYALIEDVRMEHSLH